jgi:Fe-Mn family superoxide dismutase
MNKGTYQAKQFNLSGLNGISDQTLETHFKLYEGYVKGTNDLNQRIADILADGVVDQEETPAFSELTSDSASSTTEWFCMSTTLAT